jgi:hypothetical protein
MWEETGRDTGPVYVAAALEWVKTGPTLQRRRAICYACKLAILNCSADWQDAKYCYCTVRRRQTERISGVVQFVTQRQAALSSYCGTE